MNVFAHTISKKYNMSIKPFTIITHLNHVIYILRRRRHHYDIQCQGASSMYQCL